MGREINSHLEGRAANLLQSTAITYTILQGHVSESILKWVTVTWQK